MMYDEAWSFGCCT